MAVNKVVVIGASSGGVEVLSELVAGLRADLSAAFFVVLHVYRYGDSVLPKILSRHGPLKAVHPRDRSRIQSGMIYVAPPNKHLLVRNEHVALSAGPLENRNRPSIDALFRSAAKSYGNRAIGIVLSGILDDGTAGLLAIKKHGGITIAQDPADAAFPDMPQSAIENVSVDYVKPSSEIAGLVAELISREIVSEDQDTAMPSKQDVSSKKDLDKIGTRTVLSCPDCGGLLWEISEGELVRYQCHIGHRFSEVSLDSAQSERVEMALSNALRVMKEKAYLARQMAAKERDRNRPLNEATFLEQAEDAEKNVEILKQLLGGLTE